MSSGTNTFIRELNDELVLRRATPEDADALAAFNASIHGDDEPDGQRLAAWTRDLLTRPHPTLAPGDFTIVEEKSTKRIVSSLNLIPQTWTYEGIEFSVGRPELVGTLEEYRRRGLVRVQFEEIHQWCAERGLMVQAITGIPYFYRQFGYEMALDFVGRRFAYEPQVPRLKEGESESYLIRPAQEPDLKFIAQVYKQAIQRHAVACVRTPDIFKYELGGQSEENINHYPMFVIEDAAGKPVGYLQHASSLDRMGLTAIWHEIKRGVSWLAVTPSVVRFLWKQGQTYAQREGKPCLSIGFMGGAQHPVYEALGENLPTSRQPYAFYMRVPDLPGFLRHIKPALEERLNKSIAAGHSREIKLNFYRKGLRIVIQKGKLERIEPWLPTEIEEGDIAFPGLTFLQALFGYRNYTELHFAFADCWCEHEDVRVLINILFPKTLSDVFPLA